MAVFPTIRPTTSYVVVAAGAGAEALPVGLGTSDFGYLSILQKTGTADVTIIPEGDVAGYGTRIVPFDVTTAVSYGPVAVGTLESIELLFSGAGEVYVSWEEISA
jgi:hypothetical protein